MDSVSPCSTRRLQVRLMSGRDLEEVNHRIQGLSDPFCRIRNLRTGEIFTSDPLSNTTNPNWHQSCMLNESRFRHISGSPRVAHERWLLLRPL